MSRGDTWQLARFGVTANLPLGTAANQELASAKMIGIKEQEEAVKKFSRKVQRLRKELERRTPERQNWKKTKVKLAKAETALNSALYYYKLAGGDDQAVITAAELARGTDEH